MGINTTAFGILTPSVAALELLSARLARERREKRRPRACGTAATTEIGTSFYAFLFVDLLDQTGIGILAFRDYNDE